MSKELCNEHRKWGLKMFKNEGESGNQAALRRQIKEILDRMTEAQLRAILIALLRMA